MDWKSCPLLSGCVEAPLRCIWRKAFKEVTEAKEVISSRAGDLEEESETSACSLYPAGNNEWCCDMGDNGCTFFCLHFILKNVCDERNKLGNKKQATK